jgi:S1-C subfamily serine protease
MAALQKLIVYPLIIIVGFIFSISANAQNMDAKKVFSECADAVTHISSTSFDYSTRTLYTAVGSGFLISNDGWIVTNRHVIQDNSGLTIPPKKYNCSSP